MVGKQNWEETLSDIAAALPAGSPVVVQQYLENPCLWRGRKLQFRVYAVVTAELRVWVYRHCILQFCNKPYHYDVEGSSYDSEVHITNVCANKHNPALFRTEVPSDLAATPFVLACFSSHPVM